MRSPPSPRRMGDSKPANPNTRSILTLPAEFRNNIYGWLLGSDNAIAIESWGHIRSYGRNSPRYLPQGTIRAFLGLIMSCQTLYKEACSTLYSNNTFVIINSCFEISDLIQNGLCTFLKVIGSQAPLVRKVEIELTETLPDGLTYTQIQRNPLFESEHKLIEITEMLRFVSAFRSFIDISFVLPSAEYQEEVTGKLNYDPAPLNRVFRAILQGQLSLKENGRLLLAAAIKRDGTGGMVCWRKGVGLGYMSLEACLDNLVTFTATSCGPQFTLQWRPEQRTLTRLPTALQNRIYEYAVSMETPIEIDLNAKTYVSCAILFVNRTLHHDMHSSLTAGNRIVLHLSYDKKRVEYFDLEPLQEALRTQYYANRTFRGDSPRKWVGTLEDARDMQVVLTFELEDTVSLEALRISVLPLVMETSSTYGDRMITVRIVAGQADGHERSAAVVAKCDITLQKLRASVVQALIPLLYVQGHKTLPEIWINGLGEVTDSNINPHLELSDAGEESNIASSLKYWRVQNDRDTFRNVWKIESLHLKDTRYWYFKGYQTANSSIVTSSSHSSVHLPRH